MNDIPTAKPGTQAGMILCTAGSRDVLMNRRLFKMRRGVMMFRSPILNLFELSRSHDYEEISVMDNAEVFYPVMRCLYDVILSLRLQDNPCLMLDENNIAMFIDRKEEIDHKKQSLETITHINERNLVAQTIILMEQTMLLQLVHLLFIYDDVKPVEVGKDESLVFRFLSSLNIHIKEHRDVAFYASEARLSRAHFSRLVKNYTGKTPSEWISVVTIVNAKLLLQHSDLNIKGVAENLNFPDQFTFRKYFKHRVGISPKEFRRQSKKS